MTTSLRRFQVDLTEDELRSIERLGALAGFRTKKEVVLNAITLLRWAAREIMHGRVICSVDDRTGATKQVEMPALTAIADKQDRMMADVACSDSGTQSARPFAEFRPKPGRTGNAGAVDKAGGDCVAEGMGTSPSN